MYTNSINVLYFSFGAVNLEKKTGNGKCSATGVCVCVCVRECIWDESGLGLRYTLTQIV